MQGPGPFQVRPFRGIAPVIHETVYLEPSAVVIGEVTLGANVSVWCNATLRGDVGPMVIGARTSIQDNCVVHQTNDVSQTVVGEDCTVGHGAILHGCRISDRVLVGMGAIVMDNVFVAEDCLIGAGSVLPPGKRYEEPGMLILGRPAVAARKLTDAEKKSILASAGHYRNYVRQHLGREP